MAKRSPGAGAFVPIATTANLTKSRRTAADPDSAVVRQAQNR